MPLFIISPKGHGFFILFFEGVKKLMKSKGHISFS